jgi:membrane-associated protein
MDFSLLATFIAWLALHKGIAYAILFFGMFFETLVGTSFFIPGELFLLSGSILAGAGTLTLGFVIPALYAGAFSGDSTSYFIGRKLGPACFKDGNRFLNPKNYEAGKRMFEKHGLKAIFLARLIGPFNLIMPFLSGVYQVPYRTFLIYNVPGIIIGVGQFIIAGYFLGTHYGLLVAFLQRSFLFALIGLGVLFLIVQRFIGLGATSEKPRE